MLYKQSLKLSDKILVAFCAKPNYSYSELMGYLVNTNQNYTKQALFKELRKLMAQGIIIKNSRNYSVSYHWVLKTNELVEKLQKNALSEESISMQLPNPNCRNTFIFSDVVKMKSFWSHLVLVLAKDAINPILYSWNPHTWFYLLFSPHQAQMMQGLLKCNCKMKKLIGGKGEYDLITKQFWDRSEFKYKFGIKHLELKNDTYFSIIDNYIIQVKLDKKLTDSIEQAYNEKNDNFQEKLFKLFSNTKIKMTIYNSKKKTEQFIKIFNKVI